MQKLNQKFIKVEGARQNNLKEVDLWIPSGSLTAITGVSGSGKSTLAFNILYAEGQRRYIETFSTYARQFLERMQRPDVRLIEGIPPAIAISGTNPVRTSRSTVGTMTQITDYMKLLFSRAATLYCKGCNQEVKKRESGTIFEELLNCAEEGEVIIGFKVPSLEVSREAILETLKMQGFSRVWQDNKLLSVDEVSAHKDALVIIDKLRLKESVRKRFVDSLETALKFGKGEGCILIDRGRLLVYRKELHCPWCNILYKEPTPNLFSFNSPVGACPTCRGFGDVLTVDMERVIPDESKSIVEGAIKCWTKSSYPDAYHDLLDFCRRYKIPVNKPFGTLSEEQKRAIIEGTSQFYGIKGFFEWLSTKRYKMHVRVFLARYRGYKRCPSCNGTRFKEEALLYRLGTKNIAQIYSLSINEALRYLSNLKDSVCKDEATSILFEQILCRLRYLVDVGVGYLTLDRQSRTLSGGETERVSLTTALGTNLVNTLYVLDEPSIGLHARDIGRLVNILHRLREKGNTIVVVEHEKGIIKAADHIIDLGPGGGERGGWVLFCGERDKFFSKDTLTAHYLKGTKSIPLPSQKRSPRGYIFVEGAYLHNLKHINLKIPMGVFVCITGVSGSGKSTLCVDVLYRNLKERASFGCKKVWVDGEFTDAILVDQSPIGRSPRANPATYTKSMDAIRDVFASLDEAKKAGFGKQHFSFNAQGRCPHCKGAGFEEVEMQFLHDVMLVCPYCEGRRYREDVLKIRYKGKSIAEVLTLTVDEAMEFFAEHKRVCEALQILKDVGLGYMRLGQPINTLSAGEAQRLKLAHHMLSSKKGTVFIMDEPTVGLHPADIEKLLECFHNIIKKGATLIVIEHNLDLIKCADHIIDLGPEGGDEGGEVVVQGSVEEVMKCKLSHTGKELSRYLLGEREFLISRGSVEDGRIYIKGAKEHNLKGIDVHIPKEKIVAITGVSGSGKSTLAFDILYAEGQRRYLDTLSAYARQYIRQLARPKVDQIIGIPPTVAIEQRAVVGGRKSTVATITEIYHFLRLLFARCASQYCPGCGGKVQRASMEEVFYRFFKEYGDQDVLLLAPLVYKRKGKYREVAEWAKKKGFKLLRVDGEFVKVQDFKELPRYREHTIEVVISKIERANKEPKRAKDLLLLAHSVGDGAFLVCGEKEAFFSTKRSCSGCGRSFAEPDPRLLSFNSPVGACPYCEGAGEVEDGVCPKCKGARLNEEALSLRIDGLNISQLCTLSVKEARKFLQNSFIEPKEVSAPLIEQIISKMDFLERIGLCYLSLDRSADTLSTGELQRLKLAAQLGSNLCGVCYILDEPTVGLHPRDNLMLIEALKQLKKKGNSIVVVEHDETTIKMADHIIELGPGAGEEGGRIVTEGSLSKILKNPKSWTAKYMREPLPHPLLKSRRDIEGAEFIKVVDARVHNLKGIDVKIPLNRLVCVTGVSGAGKSTLVKDVLYQSLKRGGGNVIGAEKVKRVVEVDQSPIGRNPRSCAATYVGFFDYIRRVFANTAEARMRGYTPSRFSFNVKGGRCIQCEGAGRLKVEMSFLPHVFIVCEECGGKRYNEETLQIMYKGRNIADVLQMSVDEAYTLFERFPKIERPLKMLQKIGLGYIKLGQQSPTLSGGEAQRVKLAAELANDSGRGTLYILEEPTTGLHTADVEKLLRCLHELVERGNTVVVIEHNLDVIAEADYIIDLGPEGGDEGGYVVVQGTVEEVLFNDSSYTAKFLKEFLRR